MKRNVLACIAAGALALTATVAAQDPQQTPPRQNPPTTQDPTSPTPKAQTERDITAVVEGCLVTEEGVPGRKPNVAERAGVMEDYILTNAKVIKGAQQTAAAPNRPADAPVGTSGASLMFDVKGIDDDQLKQNVGKRVQIEGTLMNTDRIAAPASAKPDDLPVVRGSKIRQVSGECSSK